MDKARNIVKQGYNQCAKDYLDNRDLFKNLKYLDGLISKLSPGSKILDLGCGSGIPIDKYLLEKDFEVTGVDISEEQINLAKKNLPKGDFFVGDMSEIDFPASSFNAVVSFYAIFHLPKEEHLSVLKNIFNILKPGGYLLITMGSNDWEGTEKDFHGVKMFWSHYGREKNLELVKSAGFNILNEEIDTSGNEKHLIILAQKQN
jgi:ubiquinone/menaquinone biosynthesis C-methylase UbiE